ncbi:hypothetical protein COE43_14430, partial [Bacillus cereus]
GILTERNTPGTGGSWRTGNESWGECAKGAFLAGGDFFEWVFKKNTTQRCPKRNVSVVEQSACF